MTESKSGRATAARMTGRTVLITGAGGLIGRAVALRLASEGAALVLTDISGRRLEEVAREIGSQFPGTEVAAHQASLRSAEGAAELTEKVSQTRDRIDGLVNVVGGLPSKKIFERFQEIDEERWDGTFALNVKTIYYLVHALAAGLRERPEAAIVNVSSVAFSGDAEQPDYAAAKAAVVSLTRSLAMDFAPSVRVNCVAPGLIADQPDRLDPAFVERYVGKAPLRRPGSSAEVAAVIAFLLSRDASYVTGEVLAVSGGIGASL